MTKDEIVSKYRQYLFSSVTTYYTDPLVTDHAADLYRYSYRLSGSTVDAEGCLWNALVYDGRLVRYDPSGRVDRVIEMPVKKVTSVMFGGPKLDVLFVTSMAKPPLPRFPGDGVLRGSLFAIYDLGIVGVPEPRFGA